MIYNFNASENAASSLLSLKMVALSVSQNPT